MCQVTFKAEHCHRTGFLECCCRRGLCDISWDSHRGSVEEPSLLPVQLLHCLSDPCVCLLISHMTTYKHLGVTPFPLNGLAVMRMLHN